jgi:hypothetical protein
MGDQVLSRPCRKPVYSHSHKPYIRLKGNKEITYFVATGTYKEFCRFKEEPLFYHRHTDTVQYILIHTGKGGGESLNREKVRGATVHKAGRKY